MGCSAGVVNHTKPNTQQSAAHAVNPNPQTRSEGYQVSIHKAGCATTRESLSRLWKGHQGWTETLCQLFHHFRDRTSCNCRTRWPCSGAQCRRSCETGNISAWACQCTSMLGCVQSTRLAH